MRDVMGAIGSGLGLAVGIIATASIAAAAVAAGALIALAWIVA